MTDSSGILIYVELLSNIRQLSLAVSLPSVPDATTLVDVVHDGRLVRIVHQDHQQSLRLPAQARLSTALQIPQNGTAILSWRIPLAPTASKPTSFSLENQEVPWTSQDLAPGSRIGCRDCNNEFVSSATTRVWKDLPSENWAEMMEFWHCHKPHDHAQPDSESLANKGYGANNTISAQSGVGFVDLASFLFSEPDCKGLLYSSSSSSAEAGLDLSSLALVEPSTKKFIFAFCNSCNAEVGLFNIPAHSVTLFKWQVTCQTLAPGPAPTSDECLAATLTATLSKTACSKSILLPYVQGRQASLVDEATRNLFLWVLNPNLVYSSSSCAGSKTAMKVLYQKIDARKGIELVESMTSDVQEISLARSAISAAEEALRASTRLLPERERKFKEWDVGLLSRWDPGS